MRDILRIDPLHRIKAVRFLVCGGLGAVTYVISLGVLCRPFADDRNIGDLAVAVALLVVVTLLGIAGLGLFVWSVADLISPPKSEAIQPRTCYKECAKSRLRE